MLGLALAQTTGGLLHGQSGFCGPAAQLAKWAPSWTIEFLTLVPTVSWLLMGNVTLLRPCLLGLSPSSHLSFITVTLVISQGLPTQIPASSTGQGQHHAPWAPLLAMCLVLVGA